MIAVVHDHAEKLFTELHSHIPRFQIR